MIIKTYQSYIIKTYVGILSQITLVFFGLILILNVFEEISYFKDLDVSGFYPLLMSMLNSPSVIYGIFPFIFLITTQFFFLRIDEKNELLLFKHSGLTNFDLIKLLSIISFFLGIFIITFFYHFSSKLKHMHLDLKNKMSDDNKYLAVVTENGRGLLVSTTPILFSAHSVNQILSSIASKPKICATPQFDFDLSSQSAQLGFLDGTMYSTRCSLSISKTAS